MIKPIMKDVLFLAQKSEPATAKDKNIAIDLIDTLQANADRCVGMAANMIGERKRIIVFNVGKTNVVMFNPVIVKKDKNICLVKYGGTYGCYYHFRQHITAVIGNREPNCCRQIGNFAPNGNTGNKVAHIP